MNDSEWAEYWMKRAEYWMKRAERAERAEWTERAERAAERGVTAITGEELAERERLEWEWVARNCLH